MAHTSAIVYIVPKYHSAYFGGNKLSVRCALQQISVKNEGYTTYFQRDTYLRGFTVFAVLRVGIAAVFVSVCAFL